MSGLPMRITPVTQQQFSETYGSSQICAFISLPLYGISLLQAYMYFLRYPGDRVWIKLMVALLMILETLHQVFTCNTVYHYSILSYSRPETLLPGEWSVYLTKALNTAICFLSEIYFGRVVYHLTKKTWRLPLLVVYTVLILAQLGFGIYVVVRVYIVWDLPKLFVIVYPGFVPLYVIRVVVDTMTAGILCFTLYGAQSHPSEFQRSVRLLRTLMIYAINRFLLTTIVVFVQTVVLLVRPTSIWAMVMDFVTAHLYANSLLPTLNARTHLRRMGQPPGVDTIQLGSSGGQHSHTTSNESHSQPKHSQIDVVFAQNSSVESGGILVEKETHIMSDKIGRNA